MIKWPKRAAVAIVKLFEPLQEIDVYVEDKNNEVFYRALLNHICSGGVRVARVFALGGRRAVIDAAGTHDFNSRRALFIIDGDFEWVRGQSPPEVRGIHRLEAYCIENLLICGGAVAHVFAQETVLELTDARNQLDLVGWMASIEGPLLHLFSAYAVANELCPEEPTVSNGVGCMCTASPVITVLDHAKVTAAAQNALDAAAAKSDATTARSRYDFIRARIEALSEPLLAASGKDYLFPLLHFLLQSKGCRVKHKSLKLRLATSVNRERFSSLRAAMEQAALGV